MTTNAGDAFADAAFAGAPFAQTALAQRIGAGDEAGLVALLRTMSRSEQRQQLPVLKKMRPLLDAAVQAFYDRGGKVVQSGLRMARYDTLSLALCICGGEAERGMYSNSRVEIPEGLYLLDDDERLALADRLIRASPGDLWLVQKLVVAGVSARPECDEYIHALIHVPVLIGRGVAPLLSLLEADPGLLHGPVLRLFEVEGNAEQNMANAEQYARDKDNTWTLAFLALIRRGSYSHDFILEKTLGTLERDWPAFRSSWFSRLHKQLAPEPGAMAPRAARYLGLCHSRVPPTVTLAVEAVAALYAHGFISEQQVCDALAAVMTSAVKGHLEAGLKLLDQVVRRAPDYQHAAAAIAHLGFAHASADVHKKVLARLTAWGFDEATRAALEQALPHVAAASRSALALLIGAAAPAPAASAPAPAPHLAQGRPSPLDPARALAPVMDLDQLIEMAARLLEDQRDIDQLEQVLDGFARLAPFSAEARARCGPLLARVRKLPLTGYEWWERPVSAILLHLLMAMLGEPRPPVGEPLWQAPQDLLARVEDLIALAAQGHGVPALSAPTHQRGFIDPQVLVARIAAHLACGAESSPCEQIRAVLRLVPGAWPQASKAAAGLPQTPLVRAVRYALGDSVQVGPGPERALFVAASRIRHPGADDPDTLAAYGDIGPDGPRAARCVSYVEELDAAALHGAPLDTGMRLALDADLIAVRRQDRWRGCIRDEAALRYAATLLPSSLDAFLREGCEEIAWNLDWHSACWLHKAYLAPLLDPVTPMTPTATSLLALALAAKEPGQCALAVDVLVAVLREGRLAARVLGAEMCALMSAQVVSAARYANTLGSAARAGQSMPAHLVELLCAALACEVQPAPRNMAALLELLLELALGHAIAPPRQALELIGALKLSGKAKSAQKELMDRLA